MISKEQNKKDNARTLSLEFAKLIKEYPEIKEGLEKYLEYLEEGLDKLDNLSIMDIGLIYLENDCSWYFLFQKINYEHEPILSEDFDKIDSWLVDDDVAIVEYEEIVKCGMIATKLIV